ncbi:MAG: hypothetical protein AAF391_00020 [Bacteroidota bacterium]
MKKLLTTIIIGVGTLSIGISQTIPLDTTNWIISARAYVLEKYKGKDAIYLQAGSMILKNTEFLNGTIEFDLFLKEEPAFPGVYFRGDLASGNAEQFYVRPHQSGNPDANQAAPTVQGITPWQLYYGPKYSFAYTYNFDDWTHVKILVNEDQAQVFMDGSEAPNLSWNLFHPTEKGGVMFSGGNASGMHLANISISHEAPSIEDFNPISREPINNLVTSWEVSDMFEEQLLSDLDQLDDLIDARKWQGNVQVEEGTAANLSRIQKLRDGSPGNTVFAKLTITSDKDQIKLFKFGYSDRVVTILNGKPIYWGNNKWRSRDYRYLGTVGLFDAVYLDLKKGKNELLMAVSEDFGGWLITGKFEDESGVKIK